MARLSSSFRLLSLSIYGFVSFALVQHASAQMAPQTSLRAASEPQVINASTVLQSSQAPGTTLSSDSGSIMNRLRTNAVTAGPKSSTAFPSTNIGSTSNTYVTYNTTFSASTTVTGEGVYTQGASGSDFQDTDTGTCYTNGFPYTYASGASCTTVVSFTPSKPGNRMGAEVVYTSTAGNYYYGYVNGIGNGAQVTFTSATAPVSTLASGLSAYGTAVDGVGNLWVTNSTAGTVLEFVPAGGVYPSSPTNTFTGFTTPQGIVIDGIGNVYIGDSGKGYIWRLNSINGAVPAGTAPQAYVSFTSASTTQPFYVAFDPTDAYLYFIAVYSGSNYLIECPITTGQCALVTTFTAPSGLAVDTAGNKYISEKSAGTIIQLPVAYNSTTKTTLLSGLTNPTGLATDAAGDLYVTTQGSGVSGAGAVTQYLASSGAVSSTSSTRTLVSGLHAPNGVTTDGSGNVFVADTSNTAVKELSVNTLPAFAFANTTVGNTSGSQSFTLQNIGNVALTFPASSNSTNPVVGSNYTLSGSTCPQVAAGGTAGTLAYGSTCMYSAAYAPKATGASVQDMVITDSNLGATAAKQTIPMAGNTGGLSIEVVGETAAKGSTAVPLEVIVGYGGGATPTMNPTVTVNGSATGVGAVACTSKLGHMNCTLNYNASSLNSGNYTISATVAANGPYSTTTSTGILSIVGSSLRTPSPVSSLAPVGVSSLAR